MSRKVFLSILGASKYNFTNYYFNGNKNEFYHTNFIQEATIKHFCANWEANDAIILFLTELAKTKNWDHPCSNGYEGLSQIIEKLNLKAGVYPVFNLPDGKNEKELWQIFDIIFETLQNEDELYIDITNAFRSLPMLLTILLNYAKVLKNVTIKSITYGNWEAKDDENYSPVINITALSDLQDWTLAANNFITYGNSDMLIDLTQREIKPILNNTAGKDQLASKLKELTKNLKNFTDNLQTTRGLKLYNGEHINHIKNNIREATSLNILFPQLTPLLQKIESKVEAFTNNESIHNLLAATEWYIQHGFYQQAYSLLLEGIITHISKNVNIPVTDTEKRSLIIQVCYIFKYQIPEEKWEENCKKYPEIVRNLIGFFSNCKFLVDEILSLSQTRNDFLHAGFRPNPCDSRKIIENLKKSYNNIRKYLIHHAY